MKLANCLLSILLVFSANTLFAQGDTWDIPATELMISHNRINFSDHEQVTANQVVSEGTVSGWKGSTARFKSLSDVVDKRLTSAFIVVADASTLYNIYNQLSEMINYENMALKIAYKYPWLAPVLTKEEGKILKSGTDLFDYLSLIILSYGDLSKMKVSARKVIFREIDMQIAVLKGRCYSLYQMMNRFDATEQIRNTKPSIYINKDAQLVKDILKNLK